MTLKLAMVGCGQIAHAHLKAIQSLDNAELYYAIDADLERARSAAEQFGAEHFSTDYAAALSDPQLNAVGLCLPHHLHAPFTIQAAKADKHILVEKPMALDEKEARQMVDAAERARGTCLS